MPRRRTVAVIALGLLLAAAPFVPGSRGPDGVIRPSGQDRPTATPGTTGGRAALTPAMRAEIDRVVAAGLAQPALRSKATPAQLVDSQVRCATLAGLRYCLHLGWTEDSQAQVQARLAVAARRTTSEGAGTGDLDVLTDLGRAAALPPAARAEAERAELTAAARAVAKVWSIRHDIEGVPYPAAVSRELSRQAAPRSAAASASASASATPRPSPTTRATQSASATASPTAQVPKTAADYPRWDKVLNPAQTAEQTRSYWCGPTSMQMIAWGWSGRERSQDLWASRLGTTTSGTDIGSIVRTINRYTGWDREDYAGPYITLDIGSYSYRKWYLLLMRHIHDYRAPLVMHPILLKKYFPYLDDDASGHYQVGRGYAKRGAKPNLISYFEPWNQQRFDPSEPYIPRVQWRLAYKSFRANQAHPLHNIGV